MAWKKGPMPENTWGWGGVQTHELTTGFFFADFCGDHVKLVGGLNEPEKIIKAHEVKWYDNSITLPPDKDGKPSPFRAGPESVGSREQV